MSREPFTVAQAIAIVKESGRCRGISGKSDVAHRCMTCRRDPIVKVVRALEAAADPGVPAEGWQPPSDELLAQLHQEADKAYHRARIDARTIGCSAEQREEFGQNAWAETVRSFFYQAGIFPVHTKQESPQSVVDAAICWWRARRPDHWSEAQHLEQPWCNFGDSASSRALALVVAEYLKTLAEPSSHSQKRETT